MRFAFFTMLSFVVGILISTSSFAQVTGPDCVDAEPICSSSPIPFTPEGPGINDFASGNNFPGCLVGLEHQAAWYYFEFNNSMPPGSIIEFTIDPNGGSGEDYDFAIYGPDVDCGTLGAPIRCSFAASSCTFCPATGLGMGASDFTEGAGGDGFVSGIPVNPGQGFYLLVDNWLGSSNGFNLTWGGSAAPFLNCDVTPGCELDVELGPDQTICSGDPNPIIFSPFVTGNTGTESYSWAGTNGGTAFLSNPFSPSPSVNIPPGFTGTIVYTLTVTDGGCTDEAMVTITVSGGTPPVISGDPYICEGGFTILDAGPGFTSYSWSNLQNTQTINVFTPGLYSVTVTDANGCASSADIVVIQLTGPTPILAGDLTICPGNFATINAEFGFNSYEWSNGATTQSITVTEAGIYTVTVTDPFFGCPGSASWQITPVPGPEPFIAGDEVFCEGTSSALSVTPNVANYAYIWSNGDSGANITVEESGFYTVTVIDPGGCQGTASIPVAEIPIPSTSISGNTSICGGVATDLTANGNFATYFWSTGENTQTISPDEAGTYSVTVTNSDGCEATASVTVTEMSIDPPSINGDMALCPDQSGVLSAENGYTSYLWSNGNDTQSIAIDGPGIYSVTVENAEGCQSESSISVSAHPTPTPTISGAVDICPDNSTTLNAGDGFASYLWSDGSTDQNFTTNQIGNYSVTVTNGFGCEGVDAVTVEELPEPTVSIQGDAMICEEGNTQLNAGAGFTSYIWSDGTNGQNLDVDAAGDYSVTVVATNGCEGSDTFSVGAFESPMPEILGASSFCGGDSAILDAGANYATYLWEDGSTDQEFVAFQAGDYSVTVTSTDGCLGEASATLSENALPDFAINGDSVFCDGNSVVLDAGDSFESYLWSDGSTDQTLEVDSAGVYSVMVTNSNGCSAENSLTIVVDTLPVPSIIGELSFCQDQSTTLDGGPDFASYMWSNNSDEQTVEIDSAGMVELTVIDDNGCEGTITVEVEELALPDFSISGALEYCENENTTLEVQGDFAGFLWSDSTNLSTVLVDQPGTVSVEVTGNNGCVEEASVEVMENALPIAAISGELEFCEDVSSVLDAGSGFANYEWSDNSAEQTLEVTTSGIYSVIVTDDNGCSNQDEVEVLVNVLPEPVIMGDLSYCAEESTLLDGGAGFATYAWSNSTDGQTVEIDVPGLVELTVTDDNGCEGTASVVIEELALPVFSISGALEYCENENTTLEVQGDFAGFLWSDGTDLATVMVDQSGTVSVEVTGNNGCVEEASVEVIENALPVVAISGELEFCEDVSSVLDAGSGFANYEWSDNSAEQILEVTTSGMYSVIVTDDNGCSNQDEVEVLVNVLPEPIIMGALSYCAEESTLLDGGAGFATYAWSNSTDEQTVEIDVSGLVELTVTDDNGCEGTTSVTVEELALPVFSISGDLEYCENENTTLEVQGDFAGFMWSDGTDLATVVVDQPGTVSVEVTGNNGCAEEASVEVIENALPVVAISGELEFCEDVSSILDAGSGFTNYEWSDNSGEQTLEVTTSGMYSVIVTDGNGCSNQDVVEVVVNALPEPEITGLTTFCSDGSTFIAVSEAFSSYSWSNGSETQEIEVNEAGAYSVTVIDSNGCQQSTSTNVDELAMLEPEILGTPSFCMGETTTLTGEAGFEVYEWTNGQMGKDAVVNQSGSISLTVTDLNGCTGTTTIEVAQLALPEPIITGQDYFCTNTNTVIDAGAGFASYAWSNGDSTQTLMVDQVGNYQVTVTDGNSCDGITNISITEALLPQPTIDGALEYCPATSTDLSTADIFAAYEWSNGTNGTAIVASQVGTYGLTVTDDLGCVGETSVEVAEFVTNDPLISGDLIFCPGESTTISISNSFVSYQWSNDTEQSALTVTEAGDYSITVTDQNGCPTSAETTIDEFLVTPPQITGDVEFCAGSVASINAGTGYLSYNWSNSANTQIISVGTPGDYFVTVVDNNGCTSTSSFEVDENPLPEVTIGGSTSYCINGFTTLNAGAVYAAYEWSDGTMDQNIMVNQEGTYGLTVTDSNGCVGEAQVDVIEDTELSPVITGIFEYCENASTVIDAGTGFASYQWSNNAGTQTIEVDQPGTYSITVMDAAGCVGDTMVTVIENALPTPSISGDLEYCDGASTILDAGPFVDYLWSNGIDDQTITVNEPGDYAVIVTDQNNCSAETAVFVTENPLPQFELSGQEFFCAGASTTISATSGFAAYAWSEGTEVADINIVEPGDYSVTVTNNFGCIETAAIEIDEIALPQADAGPALVINCDVPSVSLGGNSSQGDNLLYVWNGPGINGNNENEEHPVVNQPGVYEFSIIDTEHNCMSEPAMVEVDDQTNEPLVLLQVLDQINCTTSTVLVDGSGSETGSQIVYQWYDGNGNEIPNANANVYMASEADMYFLRVLDTFTGCSSMDSINVEENIEYPTAIAGPNQHLDCIETEASLDGTQSDTGPNIIYAWQTIGGNIQAGMQSNVALINAPGLYILTVADTVNGCSNVDSVQVTQDIIPPIANAGNDQELDCVTPAVTLNGSGSSSGTNFAYAWTLENATSFEMTNLIVEVSDPGNYILTVTNLTNGCTTQDLAIVAENTDIPNDLNATIDDPTCFGDSDGSIVIQDVIGGTAPYIYSLNGEPFTDAPTFGGLEAGEYELTVQDIIGCEHTSILTVHPGNDLNLDLGKDVFIDLGEYAQLKALMSITDDEVQDFTWKTPYDLNCLNCTDIEVRPFETVAFSAVLEDQNGCITTDDVTVFVNKPYEVYIPNVFSPNNDGHNDVFMIFAGEDVAEVKSFLTFNRWGESVFELYGFQPNDPTYGWDGKYRGKIYNSSVFVYLAEIEFIDGEVKLFKGDVTIMR